jgi:DNA-binding NtrC family response regulator
LHTLRRKAVTPVRGDHSVSFDVRIIASSDQDLEREVQEGRFLFELYYRLNCLPIQTISLAARRCDIPSIARHFVAKATLESGKSLKQISPRAMAALCRFDWPDNVLQLQRVIEDAVDCCADDTIRPEDLSIDTVETGRASEWPTLSEAEAKHVRKTLFATNYDLAKSAELLGLTRDELEARIQQYETSQPQNS